MKFKVECIKLDDMGRGICYIDDKITFVPEFLPGEVAFVSIVSCKKKYNEAIIIEMIKTSLDRVESKCAYKNCGCHLKHLLYAKQLLYKEEKVKNILYKFGGISPLIRPIVFDDNSFGYRNKITLKVNGGLGYYENKSNKFISINKCELVSDRVNYLIQVLNGLDLSKVKSVTIKDFDEVMISIDGFMDVSSLYDFVDIIYMDGKLIKGSSYAETCLDGFKFKISPDSFFQVNKGMTLKLYEIAIKYLEPNSSETVLDLYCGTGTISLLLSRYFKNVIGIEINESSIECANINKKLNDVKNCEFICGDVSLKIKDLQADKLIVDPPRSGLTRDGINDILKISPSVMVYISCDPVTLARDLKLLGTDYDVIEVTPVDMFPNTYHVECVCVLKLRKPL